MLMDENTLTFLKRTINKDGWLELPAYGNSMFPFIKQGNICRFVPCEPSLLKLGDVILFYSQAGQLIAHRLVKIKTIHNRPIFLFKGDTNLGLDQPVEEEWIIGKLEHVQKRGKQLTPEHFMANLWGKLILSFPILSGILRKHLNRKFQF